MTRCLAFSPQRLAAAAPVVRLARLEGQAKRVVVHVGHHQDVAGHGVLDDYRRQAIGAEANARRPHFAHERDWRTGILRPARKARASTMRYSPKWKIEAASTASARPGARPSTRWSRLPAPPDAITGMFTAAETASRRGR